MHELTDFETDVLYSIAQLLADGTAPTGPAIKRRLGEEFDHESINSGQLYPALKTLRSQALATKTAVDGRTNRYDLTDQALQDIVEDAQTRYKLACRLRVPVPA